MEERCGLGFKREGGLGSAGLMRKGSLVNGQALSKRRSQYSLPEAKLSPSRQTHTHTHIYKPPDPTVFLKSHQPKPSTTLYNLHYYLHQLSVSPVLSVQNKPTGEPVVLISPSARYELNKVARLQPWVQMPLVSNSILLCLTLFWYHSVADILPKIYSFTYI